MHGGGEAAITGAVLSDSEPAEELAPEAIANAEGDHALIVNGLLAMGCDIAGCREAATQTKNAGVTEAVSRVLHMIAALVASRPCAWLPMAVFYI